MEINKVLLIQKLAENKMKYVLELTDMPDFTDESGNKVKIAHCTAFMERETNVFDNSENVHCHFLQPMNLITYMNINSILLQKTCLLLI